MINDYEMIDTSSWMLLYFIDFLMWLIDSQFNIIFHTPHLIFDLALLFIIEWTKFTFVRV